MHFVGHGVASCFLFSLNLRKCTVGLCVCATMLTVTVIHLLPPGRIAMQSVRCGLLLQRQRGVCVRLSILTSKTISVTCICYYPNKSDRCHFYVAFIFAVRELCAGRLNDAFRVIVCIPSFYELRKVNWHSIIGRCHVNCFMSSASTS